LLQPSPPNLALAIRGIDLREVRVDTPQPHPHPGWHTTRLVSNGRQRFFRRRHRVVSLLVNDRTSDRSHFRSSMASAVQSPLLKFAFLAPRCAPGLNPPCKRHRLRPRMAGHWQDPPARVFASHRGACRKFRSRVSRWFMGLIKIFAYPPGQDYPDTPRWLPTPCLNGHDGALALLQRHRGCGGSNTPGVWPQSPGPYETPTGARPP
jgi:hypothetical protein